MNNRMTIAWCAALALLIAWPTFAQDERQDQIIQSNYVTFDAKSKPLPDLLLGISQETGKNIFYNAEEMKGILVSLRVTKVHWRKVIELLAERHNLNLEFTSDSVKINRPPLVTMELQDADIRSVINLIAQLANKNVVFGPKVEGTVNMRLKDVPWNEALDAIAASQNLVVIKVRNSKRVYQIIPIADVALQLEGRIFQLRYVRPREVFVPQITASGITGKLVPPTAPASNFTLLTALQAVKSANGSLTYEPETNTIFAKDSKPVLEEMAKIIAVLDQEPQQVFVDVKFIQTSNTDFFDFGFDPGAGVIGTLDAHESFGFLRTKVPFVPIGNGSAMDQVTRRVLGGLGPFAVRPQIDDLPMTDAGAFDPAVVGASRETGFAYGLLHTARASSTLRLLKRDSFTRVVQAPKLLTLDNREATIFVGRELHFHQTRLIQNDNGTTSLQLEESPNSPINDGFQLLIVPHIIRGTDRMVITVIPNNRVATSKLITAGSGASQQTLQLFDVATQSLLTHIVVSSGQTAVIGGLMTVSDSQTISKYPFIGDIPLIGYLFKNKQQTKVRSDLLIFITPRIVASPSNTAKRIDRQVEKQRQEMIQKLVDLMGQQEKAKAKQDK